MGLSKIPWKRSHSPQWFFSSCGVNMHSEDEEISCASAGAQGRASGVPADMKCKSSCSSFSGKLPAIHRDTKPMRACPCIEGCPWDCCREIPTAGPCGPLLLSRAICGSAVCGVNNVASLPSEAWAGVRSPCGEQVPAGVWRAALNNSAGQW